MQGIIGAVSLAGTTAIPLIVQRALNPSTPTPSPTQSAPAQPVPVTAVPAQVAPTITPSPDLLATPLMDDNGHGKGKKKGKKHD